MIKPVLPHERILRYASAAGFVWGLAEGTVFFIVPDVLISFVALFSIRLAALSLAASLAGSAIGGGLIYMLAQGDVEAVKHFILSQPFVTDAMFTDAGAQLAQNNIVALLMAPASGHPFKIYATLASANISFLPFLLIGMTARAARFAFVGGITALATYCLRPILNRNPQKLIVFWAVCWTVFYIIYWHGVLS